MPHPGTTTLGPLPPLPGDAPSGDNYLGTQFSFAWGPNPGDNHLGTLGLSQLPPWLASAFSASSAAKPTSPLPMLQHGGQPPNAPSGDNHPWPTPSFAWGKPPGRYSELSPPKKGLRSADSIGVPGGKTSQPHRNALARGQPPKDESTWGDSPNPL